MHRDTTIRVYSAGDRSFSPLSSLREAYKDILNSRHVIWRLFLRDFIGQFRQKILGYFWAVLAPLASIASFVFMAATGYLNPGDVQVPYPLFVFVGTGLWGIMIATLATVSSGLLGNSELLVRTNVPAVALALAGMANLLYGILTNTLVLLLILVMTGFTPSPWLGLYPILMLPLVVLGMGIGLLLATIGAVARDITTMVTTALGLVMYLTPVIYEANFQHPVLRAIVTYNPLTYLIQVPRDLVLHGGAENWLGFSLACLFASVVLILGVHSFYLIQDKVVERL